MARVHSPEKPGLFTRLLWGIARRQAGGTLPEPFAIQGHHPLLLSGYGTLELAFMRSKRAPRNLRALAELKAAALCGCEWCMDFGTWTTREEAGITEEQLRELPDFRDSDAFSDDEKLVLQYAEGISRTPVDVPDEVFDRLRERFDEAQIIELTYAAAIENLRARFNWALEIESQGYSDGAFCIRPETLPAATSRRAA